MLKRQYTLQPCGPTAKRCKPQEEQQQHLYLVVDDWERGYSVRKIDVHAFDSDAGAADLDEAAEPLPDPPVVRFEGHHCRLWFFGAHGTKILAMPAYSSADFPVYDIKTLGLTLCEHPNGSKVRRNPILASVAGTLYMLVNSSLAVLGAPPPPNTDEDKAWSWTFFPKHLPFESAYITSFAVHPDGRTLFVSAKGSTFSLDTESLEWTSQGNWVMPFRGQAYFDDELDAWVGLCHIEGSVGYVCSCDVAPAAQCPAWKLGKDQLFCADNERHLGATLLYMGNSNYCLIESLARKGQGLEQYPDNRLFYVTTFGLKYDKYGELRTMRRRARSYQMTDAHELNEPCLSPVAFWM